LKLIDSQFQAIPERAEAIRAVFEMKVSGKGFQ
jgi:hypothetical protein